MYMKLGIFELETKYDMNAKMKNYVASQTLSPLPPPPIEDLPTEALEHLLLQIPVAEDPIQKFYTQVERVVGQLEGMLQLGKPIDEDPSHNDADLALVGQSDAPRARRAAMAVVAVLSRPTVDAHNVKGRLTPSVEVGQSPLMAEGAIGQIPVVVPSVLGQVGGRGIVGVRFGRVVRKWIGTYVHVLDGQQVQIDHTLGRGSVLVMSMAHMLAALLSLVVSLVGIKAHIFARTGSGGRHQIRRGIPRGGIAVLGLHPQGLLDGGTLDGRVVRPRRL